MVVLRSSPNDMEQLLKCSNFYLKPNLRNNSVKTVNFEILKSRDIEILSLGVKKNVKWVINNEQKHSQTFIRIHAADLGILEPNILKK